MIAMGEKFATIMEHIEYLVRTESEEPGEFYEILRGNVIQDFISNGYSSERAEEVLIEMENHIRKKINRSKKE
jgi:hypothetical protein